MNDNRITRRWSGRRCTDGVSLKRNNPVLARSTPFSTRQGESRSGNNDGAEAETEMAGLQLHPEMSQLSLTHLARLTRAFR